MSGIHHICLFTELVFDKGVKTLSIPFSLSLPFNGNHQPIEFMLIGNYVKGLKHYIGTDPVAITNVTQIKARTGSPQTGP